MTLRNHMYLAAQQEGASRASTRIGEVTSYDPNTYSAVVKLKPDNSLTGWLPVTSGWIGNGWGLFCPPSVGDLVEVQFQEGDLNAGFIVGRFYNDQDRPLPVQSGECWLFHKIGAFVKLTNDGKLLINSQVEIDATAPTINITAASNVAITAPAIALNGNITLNGPVTQGKGSNGGDMQLQGPVNVIDDVTAGGKSLKTHVHSGIQPGAGNTGQPV